MALSVTNIGTGSVVTTSTFAVRAPPGNVPAGVIVFCVIQDAAKAAGTLTDSSGNVYTNITGVHGDTLFGWFSGNVISISRGGTGITYAQHSIGLGASGSYVYITGTPPSHFLDSAVLRAANGGFTTQPSLLTSGLPIVAGEAFFGAAAAVFTGSSVGTYNQPGAQGWVTPPNAITLVPIGGTQTFSLGAGSQINVGTGSKSYQPTFSLVPTTWASFIVAFTSLVGSVVTLGGSGGLTATPLPPSKFAVATFSGTGSLSAIANQVYALYAQFNGSGAVNVAAEASLLAVAAFNGTGSLAASVIKVTAWPASAEFDGRGSLSASALLAQAASARFAGAGMVAVGVQVIFGPQNFAGTGSLSALATVLSVTNVAKFGGAGSLQATVNFGAAAYASLKGAGSLAALFLPAEIIFSGSGSLTAKTLQQATANTVNARLGAVGEFPLGQQQGIASLFAQVAQFNGSGSLSADTIHNTAAIDAEFNGDGRMCTWAEVLIGTPGQTTNDECPGPGPTENVIV